jgi:hypothetical protein
MPLFIMQYKGMHNVKGELLNLSRCRSVCRSEEGTQVLRMSHVSRHKFYLRVIRDSQSCFDEF